MTPGLTPASYVSPIRTPRDVVSCAAAGGVMATAITQTAGNILGISG